MPKSEWLESSLALLAFGVAAATAAAKHLQWYTRGLDRPVAEVCTRALASCFVVCVVAG